jgi:hypothetical protein
MPNGATAAASAKPNMASLYKLTFDDSCQTKPRI